MRCCVTGFVVPNISKNHVVFIFKGNQSIFHGLTALKSEGNIILHTVMNHLPNAIVPEHSNLQMYTSFLPKTDMLSICCYCNCYSPT